VRFLITVFYPPTIPWERLRQRPHQILRHLVRLGYRCVYHDLGTTGRKTPLREIEPGLLLLSRDSSPAVVQRDGPTILYFTLPDHYRLAKDIYQEDFALFDLCDEPTEEFSDWAKNLDRAFSVSSAVMTASALLFQKYKNAHPNVHYVPNGADYEAFRMSTRQRGVSGTLNRSSDFPERPGRVAGYHGVLSTWLDWNLIYRLSRRLSSWNFVFVGPPLGIAEKDLPYAPNLFYLGEKEYLDLPEYVSRFDVGLVPFQVTNMTRFSSPIKLYEYLAAGKPVVSTPIPEIAACPFALIARDSHEFAACLEHAVSPHMQEMDLVRRRQEWVRRNSWLERAKAVDGVIKRLLNEGVG